MDIGRRHQPATATSFTVYGVVAVIAVVLAWRRMFHPASPDALATFLTEFRAVITKPVFDLGGAIDEFIGDGALVIFGSPEPRADAAARSIRCGRLILEAVAAWSKRREKAREPGEPYRQRA